ncbi:MAG: caspase family protein [Myxococcota bacterium]
MIANAFALSLALSAPAAPAPRPSPVVPVRRFALITAANDGGPERVTLRYARSDADSFARVLRQLGGVSPRDELRVLEPSRGELEAALSDLRDRVTSARNADERVEVLLYYSGHSDAEGLLLGDEIFTYRELQQRLTEVPADVRIAVLDSCASGAMTRTKGGTRRPPFGVDASHRVSGSAILTSSSENEAAQESDQLGGSFFTHYLVSGLRGAGDVTGDGRVTLTEAYQFAFHETLRRTEATLGGPQHPAYSFRLSGSGDVVMTDLRSTRAGLALDESLYGHLFVRDGRGDLAVELRKPAGRPVRLGLEPGPYEVTLLQDGVHYRGQLALADGVDSALEPSRLERVQGESTTLRGAGLHPSRRRVVPFDIGIIPPLSINGFTDPTLNHVSLSLGMSYGHDLEGVQLAVGASWMDARMVGGQAAVGFSHIGGSGRGVQLGVGFATAARDFEGFQSGVGFATTGDEFRGWQSAVGLAVVGGSMAGLQTAVGLNVVGGDVRGGQGAVGLNVAGDVEGAQVAAGLNVAREVSGAQVGLLNVAGSVQGLQLGLINVVEETRGLSLGLLNYATQDGILDIKVSSSDVGILGIALEIGTKYVYTGLLFSGGTWEAPDALGYGAYLGARIRPHPDWNFDIEVGSQALDADRDFSRTDLLATARITAGYEIGTGFLLYVGPALHVLVDFHDSGVERANFAPSYAARPGDGRTYLWPGFVAGLRLF